MVSHSERVTEQRSICTELNGNMGMRYEEVYICKLCSPTSITLYICTFISNWISVV